MSDSLPPPPPPSFNQPPGYPAGAGDGQFRPVGTNGKATASLVCGIIGILIPIVGVVALVLGILARGEISRTGQNGAGMAIAGIVLGVLGILSGVVTFIAVTS